MINTLLAISILLLRTALVTGPFLTDLLVVLCSLLFLYKIYSENLSKYLINNFSLYFSLFFIFIIVVSTFSLIPFSKHNFRDSYDLSYESSLFYFRFGIYALAVLFISNNSKLFKKYFLWSISIPLFIVSFDAIIQLLFGKNILGFENISHNYEVTGLFRDEKILGSYVIRLTPLFLAFYFLKFKENFLTNISLYIFLLFFLFITFISGERTSFFMMVILILLYIIFLNGYFYFKSLLIVTIIPFFIFLSIISINFILDDEYIDKIQDSPFVPNFLEKTISRNIYQTISSFGYYDENFYFFSKSHQSHYETAYQMYKSRIFFGYGPKMFRILCHDDRFTPSMDIPSKEWTGTAKTYQCSTHPHNTYIQLLAEVGIFGVIPVLFLFLFSLFKLTNNLVSKILSKEIKISNFNISILLSIFINFWPIMPSPNFFNNWISAIYFLSIGLFLKEYIKYYK